MTLVTLKERLRDILAVGESGKVHLAFYGIRRLLYELDPNTPLPAAPTQYKGVGPQDTDPQAVEPLAAEQQAVEPEGAA